MVSSCVPEIIGDHYEDMIQEADLPIPVFSIRTSHYNSSGHYAGIEALWTSWLKAVQKTETNPRQINLLGVRNDNFVKSELCQLLCAKEIANRIARAIGHKKSNVNLSNV